MNNVRDLADNYILSLIRFINKINPSSLMENDYPSFEIPEVRGKYAKDISRLLEWNNFRWKAFPSVMKAEVFIRPKDSPDENIRNISRISLQIKEGKPSFGVSGYFPCRIRETRKILEDRGYVYHDKGYTEDGRPKGRWWLTKRLDNLSCIAGEFKEIEYLLLER